MPDPRAAFRALHQSGCFLLPNPWDAGGAKRLEALGFKALASSSAAAAWALGRNDGQITLDQALDHLRMLCAATDLPVNADFEAGFADTAEGVGRHVAMAIETGVAGLSIEDRHGAGLYDRNEAVERLRAAREAIDRSGRDVVLVGRCESFLTDRKDLDDTVGRLQAYAAAGADCLYAPALPSLDAVRIVVQAAAPKPVNVLLGFTPGSVADFAAAGVRRVSLGGALAAAAWSAFDAAARMVLDQGRLPPRA